MKFGVAQRQRPFTYPASCNTDLTKVHTWPHADSNAKLGQSCYYHATIQFNTALVIAARILLPRVMTVSHLAAHESPQRGSQQHLG